MQHIISWVILIQMHPRNYSSIMIEFSFGSELKLSYHSRNGEFEIRSE